MSAWGEEGSPVDVGLGFKVCLGLRMGDSGITCLYGEGFGAYGNKRTGSMYPAYRVPVDRASPSPNPKTPGL